MSWIDEAAICSTGKLPVWEPALLEIYKALGVNPAPEGTKKLIGWRKNNELMRL